ncbi:MAG: type II toxin-antitoxin system ParD family antitoxin [Flavobacterium sp.]|nr:MAG: type II toxin-antitoxin system ParD family antitoxin [Flavobacterium sp.]
MGRNTSILLGEHFDSFINLEIESGRYKSASEVVRTALRLLESEEQKLKQLRKELEIGDESGIASDFDPARHLRELHKKNL